jgi:hypothetical protein
VTSIRPRRQNRRPSGAGFAALVLIAIGAMLALWIETLPQPEPQVVVIEFDRPSPKAPAGELAAAAEPARGKSESAVTQAPGLDEPLTAEAILPPADVAAKSPETAVLSSGYGSLDYAKPFSPTDDRPLIAVVVTGLGLKPGPTARAIALPPGVTLAFSSHADGLQAWIDRARAAGHEVMLDLPMEPNSYPRLDPGPRALLTSLSDEENIGRLVWHLSRASGYVGVTHNMGARFTSSPDALVPVLSEIKLRGMMYLDARTTSRSIGARAAAAMGLPSAYNNRFIDIRTTRGEIDMRLGDVVRIARRTGYAVAIAHGLPVSFERIRLWLETLDGQNVALAPVSAIADKQSP